MKFSKSKIDYIFLLILGLFIAIAIYQRTNYNYELSINNYAAFFLWGLAIILMFTNFKVREYILLIILALATFNIINFSAVVFKATIAYQGAETTYELPSVNLIILLIAIFYCIVNKQFLKLIFIWSEDEEKAKTDKAIQFYFDKFKIADESEWKQILNYEKDYPVAAQIAISKLKNERK